MLRAAIESVRMVISGVSEWALRALMAPALSLLATDAFFPRYTLAVGSISPQLTAPLSVIMPPTFARAVGEHER